MEAGEINHNALLKYHSQYNCVETIFSGTGNTYKSVRHTTIQYEVIFLSNVVYLGRK